MKSNKINQAQLELILLSQIEKCRCSIALLT